MEEEEEEGGEEGGQVGGEFIPSLRYLPCSSHTPTRSKVVVVVVVVVTSPPTAALATSPGGQPGCGHLQFHALPDDFSLQHSASSPFPLSNIRTGMTVAERN